MRTAVMKSYLAKSDEAGGKWHLVDAEGKVLGRLASKLATILMGKHLPTYTPNVVTGDFIVLINAEKVKLTGRKMDQKEYDRYSYHPGGRKVETIDTVLAKSPERVIELAVRRMLPKNKLAVQMLKRLKIVKGTKHPHGAQNPQPLDLSK